MPPVNWDLRQAEVELSIARLDTAHALAVLNQMLDAVDSFTDAQIRDAEYQHARLQLVESLAVLKVKRLEKDTR